jgi:hypothetical protein
VDGSGWSRILLEDTRKKKGHQPQYDWATTPKVRDQWHSGYDASQSEDEP